MRTDKIRKYLIPNIPYLFILWAFLKLGTAYRLAAGNDFAHKLIGLGQTIGPAFADFAPGLAPLDWLVGIVGAVGFRLLIYFKSKNAKKFRRDAEYGSARWGTEKDIKSFVDPKYENNVILTGTEFLTMNTRPKIPANARNLNCCIIGSSGSGKTTLLRCLNFLERPDTGIIKVNGETMMAVSVDISDVSTDYSAIRVVASLEQIQGAVHTYAVAVGAVCCGVLLLLVVTGVYFIRSIIRPIKQISATTRKFAKGDFSVRIDSQSHDEIGDLCASINQMADELSNTENMKNEFISSVSHELRTPLTAISGWGETLLGDETGDPRQLRRGLRIIVKEARRLTGMVEELLEFSKMQDGRFTLQVEEMDLQAELEDAIYTYRELFRQDGIQLNYHSGQELYTEPISGDPQRLKQVFCNVLDNAAKHGGAGKRIDVDMTQEGDSYVVRIRDYGPGIPPAEVPFVKQKFYKGSSKARGSGIGLAVCDEIVQRHGGVFDIGNADGGGAIVTIRLPISGQEL